MKSISLKLQLLILGLIMHSTSYAYDVEVNGIYYNIIEKAKVAEVTYKGSSFNEFKSYSGEVQIPSQIMYMENVYRVVCISKDAFRNCTDLTSISFTESIEKIENDAFSGCIALTTVNVTSLESWLKIDFSSRYSNPIVYTHRLFVDGVEVVDLVIPQNITEIKNIAFCGGSSINSVIFHNSLSSIGYFAFEGCTSLTSIQLPESITAIHGGAFSKCTNLVSVNIPTCINKIESTTFYGCSKLSDITIPESVESIGMEAFYGCSSLTSINIPSSIKEIEAFAFDGCNEIKYVDIGSLESWCTIEFKDGSNPLTYAHKLLIRGLEETDIVIPNEITKINQKVFCGCKNIKSITIPNSVTSIGRAAFSGCSSLTSIIIPNSVKTIEPYAFSGCIGLSSITLSNSLNAITEAMFYNCTNLKVITIPNSVETIGEKAFSNCSNLTTIIIGNGLNYIFSEAFSNCSNMESFTCLASIVPYQRPNVFLNSYVNYATLYVPQELLQKYESNYNWNIFGTIKTLSDSEPYKIWEANIAASDAVIAMINAIGKVKYTDACKNKINDANSAYYALTDEQKTLVVNYDVLTTAKQTYATLKVAADKVASDAVIAQIDAIGEVEYTDVCKNKIDEANKAYDILTDEQKALISNIDILTTAKQTYETLKTAAEKFAVNKATADAVVTKINAIGNVEYTDVCKGKIDEASTAYDALTDEQKALVSNHDILITAQQTYETIKAAEDKLAADKTQFNKYKSEMKVIIESLSREGDSDAVKEIIMKAIRDLNTMEYEEALSIDENNAKISSFVTSIGETVEKQRAEDQKPTEIETLEFSHRDMIYDLNGRKRPNSTLKSGLYIKNGKKVVIK